MQVYGSLLGKFMEAKETSLWKFGLLTVSRLQKN